jgi:undecaprenyl-diphosphatase
MSAETLPPIAESVLAEAAGTLADPLGSSLAGVMEQLAAVDLAVFKAIEDQPASALDRPLRALSRSANRSFIWGVIAAVLAAGCGPSGRRAASRGLASIGAASILVNLGLKSFLRRDRPRRSGRQHLTRRHVRMPASPSFPSGHSASGFAFATAVGMEMPLLAFPLLGLASAVAYSRVHTGVHYPGDAIFGSLVGVATGLAVSRCMRWAAERDGDRVAASRRTVLAAAAGGQVWTGTGVFSGWLP